MQYTLYDLEVVTSGDPITFNCGHKIGDGFFVKGENIKFNDQTEQFSHYVLASLMPYLAAKQRVSDKSDWMKFETSISCPDPQCGAVFSIYQLEPSNYTYNPRISNIDKGSV